jgi:Ni,Fe-hydrogenase III small subunit/ferredoxin-like protein FixX
MTKWVWKGIRTGLKTTTYPSTRETAPGVSPGRPADTRFPGEENLRAVARLCPTGALRSIKDEVLVDQEHCIHCFRCKRQDSTSSGWEEGFEWSGFTKEGYRLGRSFSRSLHIRMLDAGACGACMSEVKQITGPYYNIHRLGFFITPTPRAADILLVAGPLTEHMVDPLKKTHEAMPLPKMVIAVGACALSGGVFGTGFACRGGIGGTIPIDIKVPGCPPPPLAIVHALLMAAGRPTEAVGKEKQ